MARVAGGGTRSGAKNGFDIALDCVRQPQTATASSTVAGGLQKSRHDRSFIRSFLSAVKGLPA
jgi:hypothetical protein